MYGYVLLAAGGIILDFDSFTWARLLYKLQHMQAHHSHKGTDICRFIDGLFDQFILNRFFRDLISGFIFGAG